MHSRYTKIGTNECEKEFKSNGYPLKFFEKYANREVKKPEETTIDKKPVFIKLKVKGDDV